MDKSEYEEGYFKLKKSNEELLVLVNKVLNDLKQSKLSCKNEKEKNVNISAKNQNLESEVSQLTRQCEEQSKTITNLTQEIEYLKTYSKAIEGVAENYCGQNLSTQNKYNKLKRQSSLFFNNLGDQANILDIDILDSPDITDDCRTPTPVYEIEDIRKSHNEILEQERRRYEALKVENDEMKDEINRLKSQAEELTMKIEEKENQLIKTNEEMDILARSFETFKADHDEMLILFKPFQKLKAENNDLKRTSALLLTNIANDEKYTKLFRMTDDLKGEIAKRDEQILGYELNEKSIGVMTVELSSVKSELEELSEKYNVVCKERDTLKHENRILVEQKGGPGIAPPPPPPPPNAPPPPPTNRILSIFKPKKNKQPSGKVNYSANRNPDDEKVCNLMNELERKLLEKVKNKMKEEKKIPVSPLSQMSLDESDDISPTRIPIKLRSKSVPTITINNIETNELQKKFKKFNVIPIEEAD